MSSPDIVTCAVSIGLDLVLDAEAPGVPEVRYSVHLGSKLVAYGCRETAASAIAVATQEASNILFRVWGKQP